MNKKQLVVTWLTLASMILFNSGCTALKTAIALGANYAIYQAIK